MERKAFQAFLQENIMVLDGAFGTEAQKRGMPPGVCPEKWVLENPNSVLAIQKEYIAAGSNAIYTCTFGANRLKLAEYGLGEQVVAYNREIARLARKAAGSDHFVAGDLSTTGSFFSPMGELPFETAVDVYKEQVRGLLEGGVDFFVIETMIDIQETRAALLAVKESCDLPVAVSLTFNEQGRTLTGSDPVSALITLQSMGADAVGCNCSVGPEAMVKVIAAMQPYAKVPLLAKPNAGLPRLVDGKTHFDMGPGEYIHHIQPLIDAGVRLIGGCCGTSPEYIRLVAQLVKGQKPALFPVQPFTAVTSCQKTVFMGAGLPVAVVGERINPTGKKQLQAELAEGKMTTVRKFAAEQLEKGAVILDVNAGMPGIDETATMVKLVELLAATVDAPLSIDSSNPDVIAEALRIYPGRALVNSISAETVKLEKLLPIVAKYGAVLIALPIDDAGIPATAEQRSAIVNRIYETAAQFDYTKADLVVDGLVMTVSADAGAAWETLKTIDWCTTVFGCNTIVGLSNVSFGLPERALVNSAFLAMAVGRGLTMAIANPGAEMVMNLKWASDVLTTRDRNSRNFIARFGEQAATGMGQPTPVKERNRVETVSETVISGDRERIVEVVKEALHTGVIAQDLVNQQLIPAINRVGELFEQKKYFLPQLIQSAETMKRAFEYLEPILAQTNPGVGVKAKTRIVLATVKGDVHDIGKNLVGLMLKNQGFEVFDLGKDVDPQTIVNQAREVDADIIGLSALMTTTMAGMKDVILLAKQEGIRAKFMVGGAVVNEAYAQEIGADGYSEDAYRAVKLASRLAGLS